MTGRLLAVNVTLQWQSYTPAEKLAVIKYAETHGNRAAGRQFDGINEANIRVWRKLKPSLEKMPKNKKADRGKALCFPNLEKKLMTWVIDRKQQAIGVSFVEI